MGAAVQTRRWHDGQCRECRAETPKEWLDDAALRRSHAAPKMHLG